MKVKPTWLVATVAFVIYNLIIYIAWFATDADYLTLTEAGNIGRNIVLPLFLGAIFLVAILSYLRWWRPIMTEERRGGPGWTLWVILAIVVAFIVLNVIGTDWAQITGTHLMFLILAGILVGFNEEALTRGILIVGARGSMSSETFVWLFSSLLFGLLHLPNALFGISWFAAVAQVGFAFLAGSGFYLVRRVGGTLLIPMMLHGAWDFATFSRGASGAEASTLIHVFQFATYIASLVLVILVLRRDARKN